MTATPTSPFAPPPPYPVPERSRRNRWLSATGMSVACIGAAAYTFVVDPNSSSAYPQCPLKALTGLDCPGCGGLRATHAMLHLDFAGAIDHNVFAVIAVPLLAYLAFRWIVGQFDVTLPALRLPRWTVWAIPVVVAVFAVARNIHWGPLWYLNSGTY